MNIYYTNNTLYINIEDRINFTLINHLQKKLYRIVETYHINNIEIIISDDAHYDQSLIRDLVSDYKAKFNGHLIVK